MRAALMGIIGVTVAAIVFQIFNSPFDTDNPLDIAMLSSIFLTCATSQLIKQYKGDE